MANTTGESAGFILTAEDIDESEIAQAWHAEQQLEQHRRENMDQKDNEGALFVNDKKTGDKHPDYTGRALVNGTSVRIAGWKNTSKNGLDYLKVRFTDMDDYKPDTSAKAPQAVADDIPF